MAIRDTQKPNALPGTSSAGYGSADPDNDVDTGGGGDTDQDSYTTPMVGGVGADNEGHNSDYLKPLQLPVD